VRGGHPGEVKTAYSQSKPLFFWEGGSGSGSWERWGGREREHLGWYQFHKEKARGPARVQGGSKRGWPAMERGPEKLETKEEGGGARFIKPVSAVS